MTAVRQPPRLERSAIPTFAFTVNTPKTAISVAWIIFWTYLVRRSFGREGERNIILFERQ